jgi:hypothetical protein
LTTVRESVRVPDDRSKLKVGFADQRGVAGRSGSETTKASSRLWMATRGGLVVVGASDMRATIEHAMRKAERVEAKELRADAQAS